jgi:hypothetical protein
MMEIEMALSQRWGRSSTRGNEGIGILKWKRDKLGEWKSNDVIYPSGTWSTTRTPWFCLKPNSVEKTIAAITWEIQSEINQRNDVYQEKLQWERDMETTANPGVQIVPANCQKN